MSALVVNLLKEFGDEGPPKVRSWCEKGTEDKESLHDWTISVGSKVSSVHKGDLGNGTRRSEFFCNAFKGGAGAGANGSESKKSVEESSTDLTAILPKTCWASWEDILDYFYIDSNRITQEDVVAKFKIAQLLRIPHLARRCAEWINANLQRGPALVMLWQGLTLSPGLDAIINICIETLARQFNLCPSDNLVGLPVNTVSAILTLAKNERTGRAAKISNAVERCVRALAKKGPELEGAMFLGLADTLSAIEPQDAFFLLAKAVTYSHPRCHQLCMPVIRSSFHELRHVDLALIPDHDLVCDILDQDELIARNEDQIFDCISEYVANRHQDLSDEQITQIWSRCRYTQLSPECVEKVITIPLMPIHWLKIALVGTLCREKQGPDSFDAFAKRSDRGLSKELGSDYPNGYKYLEGKRLRRRDDFLTALLRSMSFHGMDL